MTEAANSIATGTGWQHFIMSALLLATGVILIVYPGVDASVKGVGVGLITTTLGYWSGTQAALASSSQKGG